MGAIEQRKLNGAWNEGARALGFRRSGEAWSAIDRDRARTLFLNCVAGNEAMADAWLGLHALGVDTDLALDKMVEHLQEFGSLRASYERNLDSRYPAGVATKFMLRDWEDLYLAQAVRWLTAGKAEMAAGFVTACPTERPERTFVEARVEFARGNDELMLPLMNELVESRQIGPEAMLFSGVALARRELFGEAARVLAEAAQTTKSPELAMEAMYMRGVALRQMGEHEEARGCLEWVYRQNPRFRQVSDLLANPSMPGIATRPLATGGRWEGPRENLTDLLEELDSHVGLAEVKAQVRAVAAQVSARRLRAERGMAVVGASNHLVFAGPPGTGKTTVARLVGRIYASLEILRGTAFVECSRSELVGEYVGQTAPKTNARIDEAMDGVLFIDEAYSLSNPGMEGGDSYGREAIETLLKRMEDDRDRLVVIVAGYREPLDRFLASNPGLWSRFGTTVEFSSYTGDELLAIAEKFAGRVGDIWGIGSLEALGHALGEAAQANWIDELGNGRFIRNVFETAARQRDMRIFGGGQPDRSPTNEELATIEAEDVVVACAEILEPLRRRDENVIHGFGRPFRVVPGGGA